MGDWGNDAAGAAIGMPGPLRESGSTLGSMLLSSGRRHAKGFPQERGGGTIALAKLFLGALMARVIGCVVILMVSSSLPLSISWSMSSSTLDTGLGVNFSLYQLYGLVLNAM